MSNSNDETKTGLQLSQWLYDHREDHEASCFRLVGNDGIEILIHREVLEFRSKLFDAKFRFEAMTTAPASDDDVRKIIATDFDGKTLELLVSFMYKDMCDNCEILLPPRGSTKSRPQLANKIVQLICAADYFQVPELVNELHKVSRIKIKYYEVGFALDFVTTCLQAGPVTETTTKPVLLEAVQNVASCPSVLANNTALSECTIDQMMGLLELRPSLSAVALSDIQLGMDEALLFFLKAWANNDAHRNLDAIRLAMNHLREDFTRGLSEDGLRELNFASPPWVCIVASCNAVNFSGSERCNICRCAKNTWEGFFRNFPIPIDRWKCQHCFIRNENRDTHCIACEEARN